MSIFSGIDWIKGFLIPLVEIVFVGGILIFISYYVFKAFSNAWNKSIKFILKYSIMKKPYPETTVKWIIECLDKGIGFYDAKKMLLIKMHRNDEVNEAMGLFDRIAIQLNKENLKGGITNDRKHKGSNYKDESKATEFPCINPSQSS